MTRPFCLALFLLICCNHHCHHDCYHHALSIFHPTAERNNSLHDNINFPWICDNESFCRLDDVVSSRWCVCLCHFRPHSHDKNFCDLTLSRDLRWKSLKLSLHITAMRRSKSQQKFVFRFSFCLAFGIITEASARSRSATCDANNFSNDKAKTGSSTRRGAERSEADAFGANVSAYK